MTRSIRIVSALVLLAAVSACSSPVVEPTYYLLRGEPSEGNVRLDGPIRVDIRRVNVAPYLLSDPGVVIETAAGEVRAARHHRWAEPLDSGIRWFLQGEVASALGFEVGSGVTGHDDWDYAVDVYISRLHGTMTGAALLESVYVIHSAAEPDEVAEYRFAKTAALKEPGYRALVSAEQELTRMLADSIAAALRAQLPAEQP